MSQKFKSDIETQAGLIDSFGFTGTAGQVLSSTGTKTEWITPPQTPGGGGSSQVFYFNGGTASSVGGYYQMSPVANTGTAADFTINANGYIASFLTDVASPNQLNIPAGNWNFEIYFNASSSGGSPSFYVELYKYSSSTFTLIASSSATPEGITNGTAIDLYTTALGVPATTLLATDRLAVRVYVIHSGRTITMHTQNGHLSGVITTFSTGLTALNGLTEQVQYFSTGTAGADFNIASAVNTHTFNLPTASAINRGALSSADWITFNSKANASGTTNYVSKFTGATTLGNSLLFDNGTNVGIGTTSPDSTLTVNGTGSSQIRLRSNDGNRGFLYVDGTEFALGTSTSIPLNIQTNGSTKMTVTSTGNVGIGTTSPQNKLQIGTMLGYSTNAFAIGNGSIDFAIYQDTSLTQLYTSGGFLFATSSTERMRIASNGNVGIGTTSPTRKLDVAGLSMFNGAQLRSTDDGSTIVGFVGNRSAWTGGGLDNNLSIAAYTSNICFFTNNSVGERMRITSAGNVGIGTTSPIGKLTVKEDVTSFEINTDSNQTQLLSFDRTGSTYKNINIRGNNFIFSPLDVEKMRITSSGNVGIGTTSPSAKLNVYGDLHLGAYSNLSTVNFENRTNKATFSISTNGVTNAAGTTITYSWADGGHGPLKFNNASNEVMRLSANGNIGIGTTTPGGLLEISGGTYSTGLIVRSGSAIGTGINILNTDTGGHNWYLISTGTANGGGPGNLGFYDDTNGQYLMYINGTNGNVGIGTTGPTRRLDIVSSNNDSFDAIAVRPNNQTQVLYLGWQGVATSLNFIVSTNGSEKMRVTTAGNIGVGTASPNASAILHLRSTTQGFLPPVMRTGERDSIGSPAAGLMIFNEDDEVIQVYTNGSGWRTLAFL